MTLIETCTKPALLLSACALLLTLAAAPARAKKKPEPGKLSAAQEKWVAKTLKKLTLDEKIGQMLMLGVFPGYMPTDDPRYQEMARQIREHSIGGFILETRRSPLGIVRGQVAPTVLLTNEMQRMSKLPLLFAADFERGTSMREEEGTSFPHNMAIGATGNADYAYQAGRITALEARALGVHWVFAPVVDVNINPDNPIINIRSYGEDPDAVARFSAAFIRGCEENGALATAKHYPGHGDTGTDTHLELATVSADRARLDAVELKPFRAAIAAGVSSIMTGHIAVPALDPAPVPATLSRPMLTDLLRKEMGFRGIIISDAMSMGGVANQRWAVEAAVEAIEAGGDVVLVPPEADATIAWIRRAVQSGRLSEQRIDESVARVLRAKARLGLDLERTVEPEAINRVIAKEEFVKTAQEVADRAVTLLRDDQNALPLDPRRPPRIFLLAVSGDLDPYPAEVLAYQLNRRGVDLQTVRVDTKFVRASLPGQASAVTLPSPESYDLAVLALFVRVADSKGTVALPPEEAALAEQVLAGPKPVITIALGSPYLAQRFPQAKTFLWTFSNTDVAERAAVRALFGEIAIGGRLPVSVPEAAARGAGLDRPMLETKLVDATQENAERLAKVFDVMKDGVSQKVFPGGVLAIGLRGQLVALRAFGKFTYDAKAPADPTDTVFDVASLTKVVSTTTLLMQLVWSRRLELDTPATRYLPEWVQPFDPQEAWKKRVMLRHLLVHSSGLPAYERIFLQAKNKQEILRMVFATPLAYEPGARTVYSDFGMILLGEIIERVTGRSLDVLLREKVLEPLGMNETMFNPPRSWRERIPPTEDDATFRKRLMQGEVHDENAWVMGGVSGHAGLFSTAPDLARFCQMILNEGLYDHRRVVNRWVLREFLTPQKTSEGPGRALGWDVRAEGSSGGNYLSAQSVGHTGFTGTSIWIDPERQLFVVLLTNRVHPTRENQKIREFRPRLHDAVVEALGLVSAGRPAEASR